MMASVVVNGRTQTLPADGARSLLSFLREDLGLTAAKAGCGEGECGACSVVLDGQVARACTVSLGEVAGRSVVTVEGLARGDELHPVQRGFIEAGAWQCGFCTPGMIASAVALLERNSAPTRAEIIAALDGNICRCCAYPRIVAAVEHAAALMRGAR